MIKAIFILLLAACSIVAQQSLKAGTPAPDFSAESIDGRSFNLSQLQGRVVVLTFWSTRCGICHSEIPKLNDVAKRYMDKNVVFLALTMENQVRIEPFLKKNPSVLTVVPNSFGVVLKYADMDRNGNINIGFPSYFVIDKRGAIAARSDGWDKASVLDSQIQRLLMMD